MNMRATKAEIHEAYVEAVAEIERLKNAVRRGEHWHRKYQQANGRVGRLTRVVETLSKHVRRTGEALASLQGRERKPPLPVIHVRDDGILDCAYESSRGDRCGRGSNHGGDHGFGSDAAEALEPTDQRGIIHKYDVRRVDGSDQPGGKHDGCRLFVLDIDHDPGSIPALRAYASFHERTRPELARELRAMVAGTRTEAESSILDAVRATAAELHRTVNPPMHYLYLRQEVYEQFRGILEQLGTVTFSSDDPPIYQLAVRSPDEFMRRVAALKHEPLSLEGRTWEASSGTIRYRVMDGVVMVRGRTADWAPSGSFLTQEDFAAAIKREGFRDVTGEEW